MDVDHDHVGAIFDRSWESPFAIVDLNDLERCNGAWRYEFYSVYDLPRNPILDSFQNLYNPALQHPSVYVVEENRFC